ncbi:Tctex1 domain-containing protein 1 [Fukomys damarensis]|uniref:Tctex1 domain-containing protein 1 n=1 Tax=Fukomys damarensis TaxID=885580 RepID=A0A091CYA7_FUKDA|nr:Tctex1 domain-containing protein 1 [Fukomys damarensis]
MVTKPNPLLGVEKRTVVTKPNPFRVVEKRDGGLRTRDSLDELWFLSPYSSESSLSHVDEPSQRDEISPFQLEWKTPTSWVIKTQVKELMIPWYKLIVVTHIGQLKRQSLFIGSRCLWDPKSDTVSSYIFRNSSLFALASVYAIYFE